MPARAARVAACAPHWLLSPAASRTWSILPDVAVPLSTSCVAELRRRSVQACSSGISDSGGGSGDRRHQQQQQPANVVNSHPRDPCARAQTASAVWGHHWAPLLAHAGARESPSPRCTALPPTSRQRQLISAGVTAWGAGLRALRTSAWRGATGEAESARLAELTPPGGDAYVAEQRQRSAEQSSASYQPGARVLHTPPVNGVIPSSRPLHL